MGLFGNKADKLNSKAYKAYKAGNFAEALELFRQAADIGSVAAMNNLATMYSADEGIKKDMKQAAYWLEKAAEQGDSDAMFDIAVMYDEGESVAQDKAKAAYWYENAAGQGDVAAMFNIALMHDKGEGVPQNSEKAAYWYEKAAEQGNANAMLNIGIAYFAGDGVEQDMTKARFWTQKANDSGVENAKAVLRRIDMQVLTQKAEELENEANKVPSRGDANEKRKKLRTEAWGYLIQAAELGDAASMFKIGLMYDAGHAYDPECSISKQKAADWYTKAAEQGDARAITRLGEMYIKKHSIKIDIEQVRVWLEEVAKNDDKSGAKARELLNDLRKQGFMEE